MIRLEVIADVGEKLRFSGAIVSCDADFFTECLIGFTMKLEELSGVWLFPDDKQGMKLERIGHVQNKGSLRGELPQPDMRPLAANRAGNCAASREAVSSISFSTASLRPSVVSIEIFCEVFFSITTAARSSLLSLP